MKKLLSIAAIVATSSLCLTGVAAGQGTESADGAPSDETKIEYRADTENIDFFVPGTFKEALKKAKETKRCLMIKAVAFGVDNEGAKCATKGKW